jgi:putative transposase
MPYARRHQLQQSLVYHAYNRSNSKRVIFAEETDCRQFKAILCKYCKKFFIKLYHWVIMPTHYHLLLELPDPEKISSFMAGINLAYTQFYHKRHGTNGYLWQGRFKAQPVQKESYLLSCGRYIERNPVRAGIVPVAFNYPFSSARYYCLGEEDGVTVASPAYEQFGDDLSVRQRAYSTYLRSFDKDAEESFSSLKAPVGNKEFVNMLRLVNGKYLPMRRGGENKRLLSEPVESVEII